jgi:hypothetical protein
VLLSYSSSKRLRRASAQTSHSQFHSKIHILQAALLIGNRLFDTKAHSITTRLQLQLHTSSIGQSHLTCLVQNPLLTYRSLKPCNKVTIECAVNYERLLNIRLIFVDGDRSTIIVLFFFLWTITVLLPSEDYYVAILQLQQRALTANWTLCTNKSDLLGYDFKHITDESSVFQILEADHGNMAYWLHLCANDFMIGGKVLMRLEQVILQVLH